MKIWISIFFEKVDLTCHLHLTTVSRELSSGGGVLELFFDRVCGPKSETPIHVLGFLSLKKKTKQNKTKKQQNNNNNKGWFDCFFSKSGLIFTDFTTSKMTDFSSVLQYL